MLIEANSQYLFCYVTEKKKELLHSAHSLTGIFKLVIHNFEKHVFQLFANDYIIFAFLNFLKYVKYKRKRLLKPFNDETTVTSMLAKSTNAAQNIIFDLPNIASCFLVILPGTVAPGNMNVAPGC